MTNQLSVIIICQNEESRIGRCLESVRWADEIIVVDSGSTDKTLEIVAQYTDKIFFNTDWPGFGPQKRFAENKAGNDWVLSIDADEVVSDELCDEIIKIMDKADDSSVYRINRLTHFCGKFIKHSGWYPDRIVRLYNKQHYHFNDALVHEAVDCKGAQKIDLNGHLLHYTFQSLAEYMDKRNGYAKLWASSQFAKGRKVGVIELLIHSWFAFIRHYFLKLGLLDGYHGFLIAVIQMQYTFNKYNYLKFMNQGDR